MMKSRFSDEPNMSGILGKTAAGAGILVGPTAAAVLTTDSVVELYHEYSVVIK